MDPPHADPAAGKAAMGMTDIVTARPQARAKGPEPRPKPKPKNARAQAQAQA